LGLRVGCLDGYAPFHARNSCESDMTGSELLQFEIVRTIAASLISLAIVLLCFVAMSRQ